jgi:hypothetical protein
MRTEHCHRFQPAGMGAEMGSLTTVPTLKRRIVTAVSHPWRLSKDRQNCEAAAEESLPRPRSALSTNQGRPTEASQKEPNEKASLSAATMTALPQPIRKVL